MSRIRPRAVKTLAERYFGRLTASERIAPDVVTLEMEQQAEGITGEGMEREQQAYREQDKEEWSSVQAAGAAGGSKRTGGGVAAD